MRRNRGPRLAFRRSERYLSDTWLARAFAPDRENDAMIKKIAAAAALAVIAASAPAAAQDIAAGETCYGNPARPQ